jgi:UDP-2-acetamido-3-amino-2,3-dideoxy-glucuronate N-acetyltransferase
MRKFIHETADIDGDVTIGESASVWHYAQLRKGARIGEGCVIGRGAYIGIGVHVGKNCKIQNYALLYEPALIEEGVFIGPAAVLTNDQFPRSVTPYMTLKDANEWVAVGVTVRTGASIGARAVCIAPVTIGKWATIGAGSVVTKDVPDFALMVGVPARRVGWVGKQGHPLVDIGEGKFECPVDQTRYHTIGQDLLEEVSE